ncbi:hypothetical protein EZV62_010845 [Acer yangbiense]|uniref:EF-hand domain-containing protein n=1 Tax=Acer yangbiense TaxID=1000413 RepID=A0A5C7I3N3_9ROSI|nr:hypothetical protein EZV62_010845 [Acer yangbiense]
MDFNEVEDVASSDAELLKRQEPSPLAPIMNSQLFEELFEQWLSLPETGQLAIFVGLMRVQVRSLIDDAKTGAPINAPGNSSNVNAAGSNSLPSMFPAGSTPPLSPRSSSSSPHISKQRTSPSSLGSPLNLVHEPVLKVIPQFYFQNGRPPTNELKQQYISRMDHLFDNCLGGLHADEFKLVTKEVCGVPSFFSSALFRKIDIENTGIVTRDAFTRYWIDSNILTMDTATQIYIILKQPGYEYLTQVDFKPLLRGLLDTHPGLEFLHSSPEFQERYGMFLINYILYSYYLVAALIQHNSLAFFQRFPISETVIYRIFYYNNRSGNGRLTLRELKQGNLIAAMQHVDKEEDINKVLRYFSYEHFYVIYCKFWELDTDRDCMIDKENLINYGNHALTCRIIDRIYSQVPRKFTSKAEGKMSYEDFVYFILSEEDKSSEPSIDYWLCAILLSSLEAFSSLNKQFKCIDLDGNGVLTPNELQYFYEEQLHRMECLSQERVSFEDILCQIIDMIAPEKKDCITIRDLKRCKLSGYVFNILFNLSKFFAFESRDPLLIRQQREDPSLTEWDLFAHREYIRLSMEEDVEDANESAEVWEGSLEAPF